MPNKIYVVAHNGFDEGHSLPYLAFFDKETALAWRKTQLETFSIAEVPIFPRLPTKGWWSIEEIE